MTTLTMFYDSQCPLCLAEITQLKVYDNDKALAFEDIHATDFQNKFPYLSAKACYDRLHVLTSTGNILLGLDGTCAVWAAVNKHRWLRVLRWPVIRWGADAAYVIFARNRGLFSKLLMGKAGCAPCQK